MHQFHKHSGTIISIWFPFFIYVKNIQNHVFFPYILGSQPPRSFCFTAAETRCLIFSASPGQRVTSLMSAAATRQWVLLARSATGGFRTTSYKVSKTSPVKTRSFVERAAYSLYIYIYLFINIYIYKLVGHNDSNIWPMGDIMLWMSDNGMITSRRY